MEKSAGSGQLGRERRGFLKGAFSAVFTAALPVSISMVPDSASAAGVVQVSISLARQSMDVSVSGFRRYRWDVSTGRKGYRTPSGNFRPQRLEREWYSTKYDNAPMPFSIFFHRGYAIHGTTAIKSLGRPASHGCVRLHPDNARTLFDLVRKHGMGNTRISIS